MDDKRIEMNKTYVIQWKSTVNGRTGRGTKHFDREEADRLAMELNREYPQIEHEVVNAMNNGGQPTHAESAESQENNSGRQLTALAA
jgi:hypothetical protein